MTAVHSTPPAEPTARAAPAVETPPAATAAAPPRDRLDALAWSPSEIHQALESLARAAGFVSQAFEALAPPAWRAEDEGAFGLWIEAAARGLGAEAEPAEISHRDLPRMLGLAPPALVRVTGTGEARFLALVATRGGRVLVLAPGGRRERIGIAALSAMLRRSVEDTVAADVDRWLADAGVGEPRRARARVALMRERFGAERAAIAWLLRLPPSAGPWRQLRQAGAVRHLTRFLAAHLIQYLLWILAWWMVGRAALEGRLDPGWLAAWGLILLTLIPLRLLLSWSQGLFAVAAGGVLKQRLLYGALRLEPEEVRHQGAGQLLGRVIESEAVEWLALSGGTLAAVGAIEIVVAAVVLTIGAGGPLHAGLLLVWSAFVVGLAARYLGRRRGWTDARLTLTNELVERMVGHRTRLAQQRRERWHEGEDAALERYLGFSSAMDRAAAVLVAVAPRGWLLLGIVGMAPALISGSASAGKLAIALGGVLLAHQAFERLAWGLWHLSGAAISWERVAPFAAAASRPESNGSAAFARPSSRDVESATVIDASELSFRHRGRAEPVFRGLSLSVRRGDRVLLEGPSGGGKSTLASVLTGMRVPDSGLVLLEGLDRQTLGADGWRRRVAAAPQFHENHVLTETLAFNLLMGRRWPAEPEDLDEAEALCRELALGDLLDRMPSGLMQIVGESGWQLSHGERSRVFIARALLQGAETIVLDESFAALDPETLSRSMGCVLGRSTTLMVIAHP